MWIEIKLAGERGILILYTGILGCSIRGFGSRSCGSESLK